MGQWGFQPDFPDIDGRMELADGSALAERHPAQTFYAAKILLYVLVGWLTC